jgi:hypothetical protein
VHKCFMHIKMKSLLKRDPVFQIGQFNQCRRWNEDRVRSIVSWEKKLNRWQSETCLLFSFPVCLP